MAVNRNFKIYQGSTFTKTVKFCDSSYQPIDISLWTFLGQIRTRYDALSVVESFNFTNGGATGELTFYLSATETAAIPVDASVNVNKRETDYCYDIEYTKPDTTVKRFYEGIISVSPEVSKV